MSQYSLTFVNNSSARGSACVFQQDNSFNPNIFPTAWLSEQSMPGSSTRFAWEDNYNFLFGMGTARPGVIFNAAQVLNTNLNNGNQVTLESRPLQFGMTQNGRPGSLSISTSSSVPMNEAMVGIGMSGHATFVTDARPANNYVFTPRPAYWVAFGNYSKGQLLFPDQMNGIVEVNFPPNVYALVARLNADNSITVSPQ